MTDSEWNFNNYYLWRNNHPECGSDEQSPINIDSKPENLTDCSLMCQLEVNYKNSKCKANYSKENLVTLEFEPGNYAKYNDTPYNLTHIYIHTPSLHTIDNVRYDCEILMVHKSDQSDNENSNDNGIIISRLLDKKGYEYGKEQEFLNEFIFKLPKTPTEYFIDIPVSKEWGANKLLPQKITSFYMYDGSMPFPPCLEKFKVFVFEEIGNIGNTNFDLLKENIGENIRPTQNIGKRKVFYNSGKILGRTKTNRPLATSDKFLKCELSDEPKPKKEEDTTPREEIVFVDEKMKESTSKQ